MKLTVEQIKENMKNGYAKKVDQFFSKYEELKEDGKFDINGIEILLGDGITAAKEVLTETTEEIVKQEMDSESTTDSKKKRVPAEKF